METEHYELTADGHDGLPCTVLLSLMLRLFPGKWMVWSSTRFGLVKSVDLLTIHMASLLVPKMLFLIRLAWEASETQFFPPDLFRAT